MTTRILRACCAVALLIALCYCGSGGSHQPPPSTLSIVTSTLADGVVTKSYAATMQASGGTLPYSWSWTSYDAAGLPPGLTLDSSGNVTGTPNSAGSYVVAVAVRDSSTPAQSVAKTYNVIVHPVLVVQGSLADGHLSYPYSANVMANGVVQSWRVKTGTLPPGLSLTSQGSSLAMVQGTPTQAGSFPFTIEAQDAYQTATLDATIKIDTAIKIVSSELKSGMRGYPYSDMVKYVNGVAPLTWSASGLPTGLAINVSTGEISGTPTQAVYGAFTVTVTDSSSPPQSDTAYMNLRVADRIEISTDQLVLTLNTASNPAGYLYATGGAWPYTWQVTGTLPPGIWLASSGALYGTATQLGKFPVVLTARDSSTPPQVASRMVTLQVVPQELFAPTCPTAHPVLGQPFTSVLTPTGGTPPYSWSLRGGSLPDGMTLNASGAYSGTPSSAGAYEFVAQVSDSGSPRQNASTTCKLLVGPPTSTGRNDALANATPIGANTYYASLSPFSDPVSTTNPDTDYYRILGAAGQRLTVSVTSQAEGLDPVIELLDANGQRFTTCRNQGTTDGLAPSTIDPTPDAFDDLCVNDDIDPGYNLNSYLELNVPGTPGSMVPVYLHVLDERGEARPDFQYQITIYGAITPLQIDALQMPVLMVGADANLQWTQIAISGGSGAYQIALAPGSAPLPPGVTITSSGRVQGTPTAAGRYVVTLTASDGSTTVPQTLTQDLTIYVADPLAILEPDTLPDASTGVPYIHEVQVTGGFGPPYVTFSPAVELWDLRFDHSVFTGVPVKVGTFTGNLAVNASNIWVRKDLTLTVNPGPLSLAAQTIPDESRSGGFYSNVLTATGGTPPLTWSVVTGGLPPGMGLDAATGDLFGQPTTTGSYIFTIQVADAGTPQQKATRTFTLNVVGP